MAETTYNYEPEEAKIEEIKNALQNALNDYSDVPEKIVGFILKKCIQTSPPEKERYLMHYITISYR